MKNVKLEDVLVAIIVTVVISVVIYVVRVLPYDNDWTCVIAECRRIKE